MIILSWKMFRCENIGKGGQPLSKQFHFLFKGWEDSYYQLFEQNYLNNNEKWDPTVFITRSSG